MKLSKGKNFVDNNKTEAKIFKDNREIIFSKFLQMEKVKSETAIKRKLFCD